MGSGQTQGVHVRPLSPNEQSHFEVCKDCINEEPETLHSLNFTSAALVLRPEPNPHTSCPCQGRPALVFGDVVYLRFADAPSVEYATAVIATDQARPSQKCSLSYVPRVCACAVCTFARIMQHVLSRSSLQVLAVHTVSSAGLTHGSDYLKTP